MTRYRIMGLHSPDALGMEHEGDPTSFYNLVQITIGPEDTTAADIYSVVISSPDRFGTTKEDHVVVLPEWDVDLIGGVLHLMVERANEAADVHPQAVLRRWFQWEYENYHAETEGPEGEM